MTDVPTPLALPRPRRRLLAWIVAGLSRRADDEAMQRSLKRLAEYDDYLLDDIGMTREQAMRCAPRSAWRSLGWWSTTPPR